MNSEKFEFDQLFQWDILKSLITHKDGFKIALLIKPEYFDLDYQKIIAKGVEKYFKRTKRIPPTPGLLSEELRTLFRSKEYAKAFTEVDRDRIIRKVRRIYKSTSKDFEEVYEKCKTFASYVRMKTTLEEFDVTNYSQYSNYLTKLQSAVNVGVEMNDTGGTMMVSAARVRLIERHNNPDIVPTPWPALNALTNAGGYAKNSVITIIDKPKKGKTMTLINLMVAYAKAPAYGANKAIYFDLENGESALATRVDQCLTGLDKRQVLSGEFDNKIIKAYRRLKRFKTELTIIRMPANSTTTDMQAEVDKLKQMYGLTFKVCFIDYIGLMGSLSGKTEDFARISDAYVDVKNFAKKNDFDIVWTGHHIKREAYGRRSSKYKPDDIAKCIDIGRHVDALLGLNQSDEDIKMGLMRLEIIEQRDGLPFGRALFKVQTKLQKLTPLPLEEVREYNAAFGATFEDEISEDDSDFRKKKSSKAKSDI